MPTVAYIWSPELQHAADQLPSNPGRSSTVHKLVNALDLLSGARLNVGPRAIVVPPDPNLATAEQLRRYHSPAYLPNLTTEYLLSDRDEVSSESDSDSDSDPSVKRRKSDYHGLEHDCPHFSLLPIYAQQVAAATLTACRLLAQAQCDIAINWDGGRHHAFRSRASGFCYVADIVLGTMLLVKEGKGRDGKKPKVLYLDLDLHYGDGVASAFHSPTSYTTRHRKPPQVLTLSVHHSGSAFFPPPTPLSLLPAADTSSPFTLAIPLRAFPSRSTYAAILPSIESVYRAFQPDYVVLQLGADGLTGDPVGRWGNWSSHGDGGMLWLAEKVKHWGSPLCVLGGGGYNNADTARVWAGVTAVMLDRQCPDDVPHHDSFPEYAPSFTMDVPQGRVKDENTPSDLSAIEERFKAIASRIKDIVNA